MADAWRHDPAQFLGQVTAQVGIGVATDVVRTKAAPTAADIGELGDATDAAQKFSDLLSSLGVSDVAAFRQTPRYAEIAADFNEKVARLDGPVAVKIASSRRTQRA